MAIVSRTMPGDTMRASVTTAMCSPQGQERGWTVQVVATPAVLDFICVPALEAKSGGSVRNQGLKPSEPRSAQPTPSSAAAKGSGNPSSSGQ